MESAVAMVSYSYFTLISKITANASLGVLIFALHFFFTNGLTRKHIINVSVKILYLNIFVNLLNVE